MYCLSGIMDYDTCLYWSVNFCLSPWAVFSIKEQMSDVNEDFIISALETLCLLKNSPSTCENICRPPQIYTFAIHSAIPPCAYFPQQPLYFRSLMFCFFSSHIIQPVIIFKLERWSLLHVSLWVGDFVGRQRSRWAIRTLLHQFHMLTGTNNWGLHATLYIYTHHHKVCIVLSDMARPV